MHQDAKALLNLMFRPGETICVSPNKYGYHSVPLENALSDKVKLLNTDFEERYESSDKMLLVALNPINGFRQDANCTRFRNFLLELDIGSTDEQLKYVRDQLKIPYSAAIFSGGKSVHFLISLDQDLPSDKVYRMFAEWMLNVATMADQNCKNPSRSIRIPGAEREPGKIQKLLEINGSVKLDKFVNWLKAYPTYKPKEKEKREVSEINCDFKGIKNWAKRKVEYGLDPSKSRNAQWFAISCEFALAGYSEDDTIRILENRFNPERDFTRNEWLAAIKSGFKHIYDRK